MTLRVLPDSTLLFNRTARDWLFLLRNETRDLFQLHSTVVVVAEAIEATRLAHPGVDEQMLDRLHRTLLENFDEVLTEVDASGDAAGGDPHERHLHAAALGARSDIVLTDDPRPFGHPDDLPFDVMGADAFFTLVDDSDALAVVRVVARLRDDRRIRQRGAAGQLTALSGALDTAGCPTFARRIDLRLATATS